MKKDSGYGIVIGGLADLENEVVHHARANFTWNFLCDDSEEVDFGDAFLL
jgi:hypothetical protein